MIGLWKGSFRVTQNGVSSELFHVAGTQPSEQHLNQRISFLMCREEWWQIYLYSTQLSTEQMHTSVNNCNLYGF